MAGFLTTTNYKSFVVRTLEGKEVDSFEGVQKVPKAMPGDAVVWDEVSGTWKVELRANYPPIVGVLEISSKTKYGMSSRGIPYYLFVPFHKRWPMMIVGCSTRDTSQNQIGIVQFNEWTTTSLPRGNLIRLLGPCGSQAAENEALFLTYNPYKMKKDLQSLVPVCDDKPEIVREPTPPMTFNIDPPGCKDIDDVLSLRINDETNTVELWITIADVAAYVPIQSDMNLVAFQQGATAYLNGEAVRPMLPRQFSEDKCSLLPGTQRLGVSLVLDYTLGSYKEPRAKRWCLSRVENKYQFEYDSFVEEAKQYNIPVNTLKTIASSMLGEDTEDPHKWIEAFMLTYNLEAAKIIRTKGKGLLRKHEMADLEKLALYKVWGGNSLAVLANRSAKYCSAIDEAPNHWGLNAAVYCHASSPIRRFADLVNQRILKEHITGIDSQYSPCDIDWLNQRQKDLKSFERDTFLTNLLLLSRKKMYVLVIEMNKDEEKNLTKCKLWIPDWNRIVTWKTATPLPDTVVPAIWICMSWFANPSKRRWKEAVVLKFEGLLQLKS